MASTDANAGRDGDAMRPGRRAACRRLAWAFAGASAWPVLAADEGPEVTVKVERQDNVIVLDVRTHVPAGVDETWAVMTDYDHMADFMPNLTSSQVVKRQGDTLEVAQKGEKKVLFLRFAFAGVKAVELVPKREIRTSLVQGDFKSYASSTRLMATAADRTEIVHHGRYEPTRWVPPAIGPALIASETRHHFRRLIAEVLRRKAAAPR